MNWRDLLVGDVLLSKDADFMLLAREGHTFTWLDLSMNVFGAFAADIDPTSNVPTSYTVLRGAKVVRKGLE